MPATKSFVTVISIFVYKSCLAFVLFFYMFSNQLKCSIFCLQAKHMAIHIPPPNHRSWTSHSYSSSLNVLYDSFSRLRYAWSFFILQKKRCLAMPLIITFSLKKGYFWTDDRKWLTESLAADIAGGLMQTERTPASSMVDGGLDWRVSDWSAGDD